MYYIIQGTASTDAEKQAYKLEIENDQLQTRIQQLQHQSIVQLQVGCIIHYTVICSSLSKNTKQSTVL